MTAFPEMIRNVAVVGHLHHGKTALLDMLVYETHKLVWDADKSVSRSLVSVLTVFLKLDAAAVYRHAHPLP